MELNWEDVKTLKAFSDAVSESNALLNFSDGQNASTSAATEITKLAECIRTKGDQLLQARSAFAEICLILAFSKRSKDPDGASKIVRDTVTDVTSGLDGLSEDMIQSKLWNEAQSFMS